MGSAVLDFKGFERDFWGYWGKTLAEKEAQRQKFLRSAPDLKALSREVYSLDVPTLTPLARALAKEDVFGVTRGRIPLMTHVWDVEKVDRAAARRLEDLEARVGEARDYLVQLEDTGDLRGDLETLLEQCRDAALPVVAEVSSALARCRGFATAPVTVSPTFVKDSPNEPAGVYSVDLGTGAYAPSFSLMTADGKVQEVEDVLEGGDTDFFDDPKTARDYFNLVNEIRKPGSSASGRPITLYTARPTKDRTRYEGARTLPANIFLTSTFEDAEGLATDLGGDERRDVWKVRVTDSSYLVNTLTSGRVRQYQTVDETPISGSELLMPGGRVAYLRREGMQEPKGLTPVYKDNIMYVPREWGGGTGMMDPHRMAQHLLPIFMGSINRTAWVVDPRRVFERKCDLKALERELERTIPSHYHEAMTMAAEYHEGDSSPRAKAVGLSLWQQFQAVENIQVKITPLVSPKTGIPGLRISFSVAPPA